jgi:MYXO-CTERM domain-containing protein
MRRLAGSATFALLLIAGTAFGLGDGGTDASLSDGGVIDGGAPDVIVVLDGASDASSDAADATVDAPADGSSDGSAIKDAKSDVCNPNVEPCTTRADTGTDTDAGDNEEPGQNGGCSCNSAPAVASTAPIALLLAALALMTRRRKR